MPRMPREPDNQRRRVLHINRIIPNILTLMATAAGLTGMRFAIDERWEAAAAAIVAAAILDTLDGRVARLLKGASKFGAELDSLSDFVCFGVAPAMILYLWAMPGTAKAGWVACMLFAMSMGLRLARFNVALDDPNKPAWTKTFFTGVPAPAGAGLALLPMVLSFLIGDDIMRRPEVVGVFLIGTAALVVSTIPTYSFKTARIKRSWMLMTMLGVAAFAAFVVSAPWATLAAILIGYAITIPVSYRAYGKLMARELATNGPPPDPAPDPATTTTPEDEKPDG